MQQRKALQLQDLCHCIAVEGPWCSIIPVGKTYAATVTSVYSSLFGLASVICVCSSAFGFLYDVLLFRVSFHIYDVHHLFSFVMLGT